MIQPVSEEVVKLAETEPLTETEVRLRAEALRLSMIKDKNSS